MITLKFSLEKECKYIARDESVYCHGGYLHSNRTFELVQPLRVCPECKGRMKVLTEEGKELIEILKHYLT